MVTLTSFMGTPPIQVERRTGQSFLVRCSNPDSGESLRLLHGRKIRGNATRLNVIESQVTLQLQEIFNCVGRELIVRDATNVVNTKPRNDRQVYEVEEGGTHSEGSNPGTPKGGKKGGKSFKSKKGGKSGVSGVGTSKTNNDTSKVQNDPKPASNPQSTVPSSTPNNPGQSNWQPPHPQNNWSGGEEKGTFPMDLCIIIL